MTWCLRTFVALAKDLSLVPRTHMSQFITAGNSCYRNPLASMGPWTQVLIYSHMYTHLKIKKNLKNIVSSCSYSFIFSFYQTSFPVSRFIDSAISCVFSLQADICFCNFLKGWLHIMNGLLSLSPLFSL